MVIRLSCKDAREPIVVVLLCPSSIAGFRRHFFLVKSYAIVIVFDCRMCLYCTAINFMKRRVRLNPLSDAHLSS